MYLKTQVKTVFVILIKLRGIKETFYYSMEICILEFIHLRGQNFSKELSYVSGLCCVSKYGQRDHFR